MRPGLEMIRWELVRQKLREVQPVHIDLLRLVAGVILGQMGSKFKAMCVHRPWVKGGLRRGSIWPEWQPNDNIIANAVVRSSGLVDVNQIVCIKVNIRRFEDCCVFEEAAEF